MTRGEPGGIGTYERFFGLNEPPFSLAPDPRFLFASASHSAALAQVAYALERREPVVVLTGEIGTGKTLLCQTVLQRLERKTFLSIIDDPFLGRDDLLKQLLQDFGVISKDRTRLTETSRHDLIQTLHDFLRSLVAIQGHAVVIIDEAQHLQPDVLEQIRLLSNVHDGHGTLLQIILVGQMHLEQLLSRPELHQLHQRVSRRLRLEPLTPDEVRQYIEHRLALARNGPAPSVIPGAPELARALADWDGTANAGVEFTPEAILAVSQLSGGLPRLINLLCDRSLEDAFAARLRLIDDPLIRSAAHALGVGETPAPTEPAPYSPATTAATPTVPDVPVYDEPSGSLAPGPVVHVEDAVPVEFNARGRAVPGRLARSAVVAGAIAFVAVAIWLGARQMRSPQPAPAAAPVSPATRAPAQADPGHVRTGTPAPDAPPNAGPPNEPPVAPPAPPVTAAPAAGAFDVVVASFRTDARAASVAADVVALGLPIRRRMSGGWQQVVCGPFASRTEAEDAQRRLGRAGLSGTQIVPIAR